MLKFLLNIFYFITRSTNNNSIKSKEAVVFDDLNPRPQPEGSYKIGSVCPPVLPSVRKFSRDWLISFFLKLSMVLGAHIYLCVTETDFLEKAKMTKNGQKWSKTWFLDFFKKSRH